MNAKVLFAVFKRDFTAYFASPLGYVFIFVFVLSSTVAAFWSVGFFANNLANLDQLNRVFPYVMLIFVPAITMAVWANERRQGTDELLLTLPASDLDIVAGKYLATVGIFTVSLLYSLLCNFVVLRLLGTPDPGLFLGTYLGYWFVGLAMLGVAMTASFLTSNLTVAFILGAMFNAPLVLLDFFDLVGGPVGNAIKQWGIPAQFRDFGQGIITFSGVVYFLMIVAVSLYVSMILIGRRHWFAGQKRHALVAHYAVRAAALVAITVGINALFHDHDLRADVTKEQLSTLLDGTKELLSKLPASPAVKIEAFISPEVPESYVQTRLNLISMLRELEARSGGKVRVNINDTERYSEQADRAQKRYGIQPRRVGFEDRGTFTEDQIYLHVVVSGGLRRVGPIFFDRGVPVEYELVRSIATVAETARKKIGVVKTDAQLFGQFNFQSMAAPTNWPIIDELEKQYDVAQIDLSQPIEGKFDAVIAVQPSTLGPEEMNRFVELVGSGVPTAIFEDPMPVFASGVTATSEPKTPPMNMMMMGMQQPPTPKGDISKLWELLGVDFPADEIVWQNFNPIKRVDVFQPEFVFIQTGEDGLAGEFNEEDPISSGLQQMLFPFPGLIRGKNTSKLSFTPLVETGTQGGTVRYGELLQRSPFGQASGLNEHRRHLLDPRAQVLAAEIKGTIPADKQPDGANAEGDGKAAKAPVDKTINVVVVTDLDMLTQDFFRLREQGNTPESGVQFNFDNVTFVLNAVDRLAGETRFLDLRKRRLIHQTLTSIDKWTKESQTEANDARDKFLEDYIAAERVEKETVRKKLDEMRGRKGLDPLGAAIELQMMQEDLNRRMEVKLEAARQDRDRKMEAIKSDLSRKVQSVQNGVKVWAVALPPAPLVLLAFVVWLVRRSRESEGVARSRMR